MGFIDSFAKRVAEQISKAPILPAGTNSAITVGSTEEEAKLLLS